jgi:hypothetical protein
MKWRFYFITWLYSVLINTVLISLLVFGPGPSYLPAGERVVFVLEQMGFVGMLSVPFSMPGLLALILSAGATDYFIDAGQRFSILILSSLLGTFAGYLLMWVVLDANPFDKAVIPGMGISFVAVLAALFINQRLFYKVFMPGYKKQSLV